jgi:hypothetical protein
MQLIECTLFVATNLSFSWAREKDYSKYRERIAWLEWSIRELEDTIAKKVKLVQGLCLVQRR